MLRAASQFLSFTECKTGRFKLGVFFQFFDITGILAYSFGFIAVVLVIEYLVLAPLDKKLAAWRP